MAGAAARGGQHPVRMGPVQIAVLIYHLRLYPQPERKAHFFYPAGYSRHSLRQLFPVGIPVSQGGPAVIPSAEPAVIQYKKFHSHIFGGSGKLKDFFFVKVEIGGFPVID